MSTRAKKPKQSRKPAPPEKKANELLSDDRKAKLGKKFVCYSCKTRFYDMNKPEPICPKCGANQRTKPKDSDVTPPAPPPTPKKAVPRPMPAALLDDEDEAAPVPFEDEMDLDLGDLEPAGDELFEEGEDAAEGEPEEFDET
jgi:hypothetical protein